jgi:hypothetical protein
LLLDTRASGAPYHTVPKTGVAVLRTAVVVTIALLAQGNAAAQRVAPSVGTRIRITPLDSSANYLIGTVVGQTGDTLVVLSEPRDTVQITLATVDFLEVSGGTRANVGKGIGIGSLVGAAGGAAIGAAAIDAEWREVGALLGAGVGALGGLLVGAVVGGSVQTERWNAAPGWDSGVSLSRTATGFRIAMRF